MIRFSRGQWVRILTALVLIGLSWWGMFSARSGIVVRSFSRENVPMISMVPENARSVPGVLVAHGFAGSKQLMLGYGHVLARAGYGVVLWDFDGHGANSTPLQGFRGDSLEKNLQVALRSLLEIPEIDRTKLALLGHSMGSGVVISAGVNEVDRFSATIGVSPSGQNVSPTAPRNLQLQVGAWEGRLLPYVQRALEQAGGSNSQFAEGRAREMVIVPTVEHITILFSQVSHQAALRWLDSAFGRSSNSTYVDRRMIWYFTQLAGWLLGLSAVSAKLRSALIVPKFASKSGLTTSNWRSTAGLVGGAIVATGGLAAINPIVNLQALGGVQVGGAVGIWFLISGIVWLAIQRSFPKVTQKDIGLGLAMFALLWIAVGVMAQQVWLQWELILPRLKIWLPIAIACFPWFLAAGIAQENRSAIARFGGWLGQSAVLIIGFFAVIIILPSLGFMFLLLPLFPFVFGLLSFVASLLNSSWSYAISSSLFFAWLLAAGFPLSGVLAGW